MKAVILLYLSALFNAGNSTFDINATIEYYENLINTEVKKVASASLPQDSSQFRTFNKEPKDYGEYDYIIVGAGSAGSVVTSRLSAITTNKVLVIEAGGFENAFSEISGLDTFLQKSEFNWNYNSTPQDTSCLGMINKECGYPRGKGIGGSSIINGLFYVRGNRHDYDTWAALGNLGWSYKDVLPYFLKSEHCNVDGDRGYHGYDGNLNVEHHKPYHPHLSAFVKANLELGRQLVDYNGRKQLGVSPIQANTIFGRRISSATAFLKPILNRTNLKVLTHSLALKLIIDEVSKDAHALLFSRNKKMYIAYARKEIIVCAGSINSPQLLMLSGIGPEEQLRHHNIPIIKSLPVGQNFQDHPVYLSLVFETNYTTPTLPLREHIKQYLYGYGTLTMPSKTQGIAFIQTKYANVSGVPDIEIIFAPPDSSNTFSSQGFHYTEETTNSVLKGIDSSRSCSLFLVLLHPKSRGAVRLKSADPIDFPLIDMQLLSDPNGEDIEVLYEGIQKTLELLETRAFRRFNATLFYRPLPACQSLDYMSKEYWYCQIRHLTAHSYHPVSTCKMGPSIDKEAVVNHELKVHGIGRLRVADASIIPLAISGHTNAAAMMIGEKVSDMIINEHTKLGTFT